LAASIAGGDTDERFSVGRGRREIGMDAIAGELARASGGLSGVGYHERSLFEVLPYEPVENSGERAAGMAAALADRRLDGPAARRWAIVAAQGHILRRFRTVNASP